MRKLILGLLFTAAVLGIVGFMPSEANAYWIRTRYGIVNAASNGPYGTYYMAGWPSYNWNYTYNGYRGWAYNYPNMYTYSSTPNSLMSLYATGGMRAYMYKANAGYSYRIVTPAYSGYMISPYTGYKTISVPSSTYMIPLSNPYYGGYLNSGYYPYYP